MLYILSHKNIPVMELLIDSDDGSIIELHDILNIEHMPLGTVNLTTGRPNKDVLKEWWNRRQIPVSRNGLEVLLDSTGIKNLSLLPLKCFGLSLSDQYWVNPVNRPLQWSNINFFDNAFSEDFGNILFGQASAKKDKLSLNSPDNTSDGVLKKRWFIKDGKRILMKSGTPNLFQEPFNEVITSKILDDLNIYHVNYELQLLENEYVSLCDNFLNNNVELIHASILFFFSIK
jgi:hypothetical protein